MDKCRQNEVTGANLAREARRLLEDERAREEMRAGLADVAASLSGADDPMAKAAAVVPTWSGEGPSDVTNNEFRALKSKGRIAHRLFLTCR